MRTANLLAGVVAAPSFVALLASAAETRPRNLHARKKMKKSGGIRNGNSGNDNNNNNGNGIKNGNDEAVMDEEDVAFWTRLLQGDRGTETGIGSMPQVPRPPPSAGGGDRTSSPGVPDPTRRPTRNPTRRPTPNPTPRPSGRPTPNPTPRPPVPTPTPGPPAFNCPPTDFVGCTAPDPSDPEDECPTVGEPCATNGEFCCLDGCPRNFCTAKEAPPGVA